MKAAEDFRTEALGRVASAEKEIAAAVRAGDEVGTAMHRKTRRLFKQVAEEWQAVAGHFAAQAGPRP